MRRTGLALAILLVAASPAPGFAACELQESDKDLAFAHAGGLGNGCAEDTEQRDQVCAPEGQVLDHAALQILESKNLDGKTELVPIDGRCAEVRTSGHPSDGARTPNGWVCGAASRTIRVSLFYCR